MRTMETAGVSEAVRAIIDDVAKNGDAALRAYCERFDGAKLDCLAVSEEEMAAAIPGAQLYMAPNGGHVQHWEQLDKYNQVTLDFLLAHR